jgi:hypothetical protein
MTGIDPVPMATPAALSILQDTELTAVNVWKYGVTLTFNNQLLTITVESNAEFSAPGRVEVFQQEVIVAFGARMLTLIGYHVVGVSIRDDKVLTLTFSDGSKVTLRPDASGHESYSINLPDNSMFIG